MQWLGGKGPDHGIGNVYIDKQLVCTVDAYAPTAQVAQILFEKTDLSTQRLHTIRVELRRGRHPKATGHKQHIHALIGDLIDIGVDLLNPVQVSAGEMGDTARLKRELGTRISFCGAVDTRWVMPKGTADDVRREVRRRIADFAPGGGYVAAAVHCIQPDVPPENVMAMCDEVQRSGKYPVAAA